MLDIKDHPGLVRAVASSPDGTMLVSGCEDGTVRVWDPVSGKLLRQLEGHAGRVNAIAFNSDSSRLASAASDTNVKVWDPVAGREVLKLRGHQWSATTWRIDTGVPNSSRGVTTAICEFGTCRTTPRVGSSPTTPQDCGRVSTRRRAGGLQSCPGGRRPHGPQCGSSRFGFTSESSSSPAISRLSAVYRRVNSEPHHCGDGDLGDQPTRPIEDIDSAQPHHRRSARALHALGTHPLPRPLHRLYGHTIAANFGPKSLAAVRQEMVKSGWCRTVINRRIDRVRRAFRWATAEELVPVTIYTALRTLPGLTHGRTDVRESQPVKPVDASHVAAVLPDLSRHVRAMAAGAEFVWRGMRPVRGAE